MQTKITLSTDNAALAASICAISAQGVTFVNANAALNANRAPGDPFKVRDSGTWEVIIEIAKNVPVHLVSQLISEAILKAKGSVTLGWRKLKRPLADESEQILVMDIQHALQASEQVEDRDKLIEFLNLQRAADLSDEQFIRADPETRKTMTPARTTTNQTAQRFFRQHKEAIQRACTKLVKDEL